MDKIMTSIVPWLCVSNGKKAIEFYRKAFGAEEVFHLDGPDDSLVSRLSVSGAEFWISGDRSFEIKNESSSIRLILTVDNPDEFFAKALTCGAAEVFPVSEEHGWRLGRITDPFGHEWEIGKPV
jgi:PhnB protein